MVWFGSVTLVKLPLRCLDVYFSIPHLCISGTEIQILEMQVHLKTKFSLNGQASPILISCVNLKCIQCCSDFNLSFNLGSLYKQSPGRQGSSPQLFHPRVREEILCM